MFPFFCIFNPFSSISSRVPSEFKEESLLVPNRDGDIISWPALRYFLGNFSLF